jgi:hypothetical protein
VFPDGGHDWGSARPERLKIQVDIPSTRHATVTDSADGTSANAATTSRIGEADDAPFFMSYISYRSVG